MKGLFFFERLILQYFSYLKRAISLWKIALFKYVFVLEMNYNSISSL
ncbi:hypothetical protein ADIARSV_3985 [Arcticibacter svalbardensis MN12-7]|uniref:Uncharacterized protein n=1 Tax=Arcticibacter svalbardensis MN12-7 TaxID=1150600 RepID=R9GM35_9SPHI|nr:hypothetical protein ADIARSV_3985 [Arcticibacter svalbardensis MN12-7]